MAELLEILSITILIMCCGTQARSDAYHRYKAGDPIPFYANKVGPFRNPSETYAYFDFPFCSPVGPMAAHVKEKKLTLGEALNGDRLVSAPYEIAFLVEEDARILCTKRLHREEVSQFRSAVAKDYYTQMYFDDLPIWAFMGRSDSWQRYERNDNKYFLFNHTLFEIIYNKDRVIEISARTDPNSVIELTEDEEVDVKFMYTVKWKETESPFAKRMEKYTQSALLPHHLDIHRSSILYSCVEVLMLIGGLLMFYVRVIKEDISKYANDEELANDQEETGWKYIHGDVFRFPKYKSLFAAALGSGTQLFMLMLFIIILGVVGIFHPYDRGVLLETLVIVYAITSVIAGYMSVSFYYQFEGSNWVRNLFLTGSLFLGPIFLTFCFLNTVAIAYKANAALPLGTIVVISLLWAFLASPLLLLGGIAGKNSKSEFKAPCRTTNCPREIPLLRWYRGILPQMAMAGILPFSVLYMELYYIFNTVWGHRIFTMYGILSIVFVILLIVTAFVNVALTYFQLAAEDYEWWWRSFLCGGSTGLYIYGYCFHYYFTRTDMSGLLQISFFFGYMACVCYGIFLMLGTVGFFASLLFVRHLYGSIKCE